MKRRKGWWLVMEGGVARQKEGTGEKERENKSATEPKRGKGKQMKSDTLIQRASSA